MRLLAILSLCATTAGAQSSLNSGVSYDREENFHRGEWELGGGAAVMFSPFGATRNRPTHNYAVGILQAGWMLSDINEWGAARGNFELVGEGFGGGVFVGRGNYVSGFTLWLRYNFIQPGWKWVPYAQIGAGGTATDIDQRIVGQVFQFNLDAAVGTRYFIKPNVSINAEYRYQHISNANIGPNNLGINAQGAMLGASYFF